MMMLPLRRRPPEFQEIEEDLFMRTLDILECGGDYDDPDDDGLTVYEMGLWPVGEEGDE